MKSEAETPCTVWGGGDGLGAADARKSSATPCLWDARVRSRLLPAARPIVLKFSRAHSIGSICRDPLGGSSVILSTPMTQEADVTEG